MKWPQSLDRWVFCHLPGSKKLRSHHLCQSAAFRPSRSACRGRNRWWWWWLHMTSEQVMMLFFFPKRWQILIYILSGFIRIFGIFTPNVGGKNPILTIIFFRWVGSTTNLKTTRGNGTSNNSHFDIQYLDLHPESLTNELKAETSRKKICHKHCFDPLGFSISCIYTPPTLSF